MSSLLKIEWTILSHETPLTNRPCSRCRAIRPFASTGKFRLNANGSRLDAWLVFSCLACGKRWNKTLFERRPVKSISREQLEALQANDPQFAERLALEGSNSTTEQPGYLALGVRITAQAERTRGEILLTVRNPSGSRVRLDRVLARGPMLTRKEVHRLAQNGVLEVQDASPKAIRRHVSGTATLAIFPDREKGISDLITQMLSACGSGRA
ncbi:DUF1062 domain-containing protein [Roseibium marinum]|uniref:DUF1062 domain-containing protein n=1 Tax=Roseibium marinum TaxID=281252 RepID=A0A2S3UMF5_9HYPH|nr:DUF1062 domain-containing protein [Roseibium marinum]POF28750.1 hypothetical protein CLV41_112166 [Roseibium marinum]